ncbi:hypothetical protein EVAR_6070_1 [Eumeta japonica]|uniref:Uncharacterized protein n=1 Tax=Eumeta variegata TaxID=151549 RepID=A0A4C1TE39_EUMVA|nr:hypothetical protein EVAR_6070_1 [Eumeta japonica]
MHVSYRVTCTLYVDVSGHIYSSSRRRKRSTPAHIKYTAPGYAVKIESTGFDLDQGRIDKWVFNLSQLKPLVACLGEHVKSSVSFVIIALPTAVIDGPQPSLGQFGGPKVLSLSISNEEFVEGYASALRRLKPL